MLVMQQIVKPGQPELVATCWEMDWVNIRLSTAEVLTEGKLDRKYEVNPNWPKFTNLLSPPSCKISHPWVFFVSVTKFIEVSEHTPPKLVCCEAVCGSQHWSKMTVKFGYFTKIFVCGYFCPPFAVFQTFFSFFHF